MIVRLAGFLFALVLLLMTGTARAQDKPSGALDFGVDFHHSMGDHNVLGIHARAMAVDRVPGTMVGRFGELYASVGVGLDDAEFVQFSVGMKLGVGLGTDYFVLFLASGLMTDGYLSTRDSAKKDKVKPGLGLPLLLGLWVDPIPGFYFYAFAEPSWAFLGDRKTTPFIPFNWAWELRLRGGVGFDISSVHVRVEYTFHQVAPDSWHIVSLGFGLSSQAMAKLGLQPVKE